MRTPLIILLILIPLVFAFDSRYDIDGSGTLDLKDVTVLRQVILREKTCPEGVTCDINGDGSTDSLDGTELIKLIRSGNTTTTPVIAGEVAPTGEIVDMEIGKRFKLSLHDTGVLTSPQYEMRYVQVKRPSCKVNQTCLGSAIVDVNGTNYTIMETTAKTVDGIKMLLESINSRNNTIWMLTLPVTCDGCWYKSVCVPTGDRDENLKVICFDKKPVPLKLDGDSCGSSKECMNNSCIESLCQKKATVTPIEGEQIQEIVSEPEPTQEVVLPSKEQPGLFGRLWIWILTLFK